MDTVSTTEKTDAAAEVLGQVVLLAGLPGPGYEALRATLTAHSRVAPAPARHLLTPVAYLGYYDKVYKAPYDHILAAEAQRLFVEQLPAREGDYVAACRAYCAGLYGPARASSGAARLLDATPEYVSILPFLRRVLPDAPLLVAVQHPFAFLTEQDPEIPRRDAREVARWVEAVGRHVRSGGRLIKVRYEDYAADPASVHATLWKELGLEPEGAPPAASPGHGRLGASDSWAVAFQMPDRLAEAQYLYRRVAPEDFAAFGYPAEELWLPVESVLGRPVERPSLTGPHALRHRALAKSREIARRPGAVNRLVRKVRLACDVLLRE